MIGELPRSLPTLALPEWPGLAALSHLVLPMFVLGLVSFLETAASARVDNARKGVRWQRDQDLIGQGLAKLASAFSGGFSTSTSFTRSALNLYAGAQTGWAAVFTVLTVLAAFMLLTPVLRHVPQAVLTAIIVAAVAGLIKPREYRRLWRVSRAEAVMALLTVALTIATAPALYWGVLAGVLMTLARFVYQRLHPRIVEVGLHADGSLRNRHPYGLPLLAPHTLALRMDAALDFATANSFEQYVDAMLAAHAARCAAGAVHQPARRHGRGNPHAPARAGALARHRLASGGLQAPRAAGAARGGRAGRKAAGRPLPHRSTAAGRPGQTGARPARSSRPGYLSERQADAGRPSPRPCSEPGCEGQKRGSGWARGANHAQAAHDLKGKGADAFLPGKTVVADKAYGTPRPGLPGLVLSVTHNKNRSK